MASDTITEEIKLTESIHMLPLDEDIWVNKILFLSKSQEKRHVWNIELLREQGFDIKDQIKRIEKGYSGVNKLFFC